MNKTITFFLVALTSCFQNPTDPKTDKEKNLKAEWKAVINIIDVPTARPLIVESQHIIYTGEYELVALNVANGEETWRTSVDGSGALESKVLLYDEKLNRIVSNHFNSVFIWDAKNGNQLLTINEEYGVLVFRRGRNTILNNGYGFVGDTLDAYVINKDGSVRFQIDIDYGTSGISYYDEKVYLSQVKTINGGLTLGKVRAFSSITGDSLWSYSNKNGGFDWAAPIVEEGVVYAGAIGNSPIQEFVALNAETGELIWRQTNKVWTFNFIVGPNLVYVNTGGTLVALNKQTGAIEWRFEWESSAALITPVYLEGYIYHSDHGRIFILDADNGELVHEEPLPKGGGFFWHLAVSEDKLFAQTSYQLIAYQPWHLRED